MAVNSTFCPSSDHCSFAESTCWHHIHAAPYLSVSSFYQTVEHLNIYAYTCCGADEGNRVGSSWVPSYTLPRGEDSNFTWETTDYEECAGEMVVRRVQALAADFGSAAGET